MLFCAKNTAQFTFFKKNIDNLNYSLQKNFRIGCYKTYFLPTIQFTLYPFTHLLNLLNTNLLILLIMHSICLYFTKLRFSNSF